MRSTDRKMSLLNFVVTTVKTHFPELHSFAQTLNLEDATQGSYPLLLFAWGVSKNLAPPSSGKMGGGVRVDYLL